MSSTLCTLNNSQLKLAKRYARGMHKIRLERSYTDPAISVVRYHDG